MKKELAKLAKFTSFANLLYEKFDRKKRIS